MSITSPCFDAPQGEPLQLAKLQKLSLDNKILYSQVTIKEFYIAMKGKVYVSISGGKDSVVLLHLVRSIYPDVPAVFVDTGLEFPENRELVKKTENVTWLKPEKSFRQVVKDEGYPCYGKEIATYIDLAQRGNEIALERFQRTATTRGLKRYSFMIDAPFRVGSGCCKELKKKPIHKFQNETGLAPIIGTRTEESTLRLQDFVTNGDNRIEGKKSVSKPLSIWMEKDIWDYIRRYDLEYSSIYDRGQRRTGCVFCMFGIMFDRHRFVNLKHTHPELWAYCMKDWDKGGLGMREVLDYMNIPTGIGQSSMADYGEEEE